MILPKLSGIVKENAGHQKIDIQLRVERRNRHCRAHHLRGVFDQTAAASVMVFSRCGCPPEPFTELFDETVAK